MHFGINCTKDSAVEDLPFCGLAEEKVAVMPASGSCAGAGDEYHLRHWRHYRMRPLMASSKNCYIFRSRRHRFHCFWLWLHSRLDLCLKIQYIISFEVRVCLMLFINQIIINWVLKRKKFLWRKSKMWWTKRLWKGSWPTKLSQLLNWIHYVRNNWWKTTKKSFDKKLWNKG